MGLKPEENEKSAEEKRDEMYKKRVDEKRGKRKIKIAREI